VSGSELPGEQFGCRVVEVVATETVSWSFSQCDAIVPRTFFPRRSTARFQRTFTATHALT